MKLYWYHINPRRSLVLFESPRKTDTCNACACSHSKLTPYHHNFFFGKVTSQNTMTESLVILTVPMALRIVFLITAAKSSTNSIDVDQGSIHVVIMYFTPSLLSGSSFIWWLETRVIVTTARLTASPFKTQRGTGFQFTPTKRRLSTSQPPILEQVLKPSLSRYTIESVSLLPSHFWHFTGLLPRATRDSAIHVFLVVIVTYTSAWL